MEGHNNNLAEHQYLRAPAGAVTAALVLHNVGPAAGVAAEAVRAGLARLAGCEHSDSDSGSVSVLVPEPGRARVVAVFRSEAAAARALEALLRAPDAPFGRRVYAYHAVAVPKETPGPGPVSTEAHTSPDGLGVQGLQLLRDFVTAEEERGLLEALDRGAWVALAKRRVQHYGRIFDYEARSVAPRPGPPWPEAVAGVVAAVQRALPTEQPPLDQLTVNEYLPGVGLAAHVDTHSAFTGAIASLSLAGRTVMEFRRGGRGGKEEERAALALPARSLLILSGPARYEWHHYIPHRKSDVVEGEAVPRDARRVSLTLRTVRGFPCSCQFPAACDSQGGGMPPTRLAEARAAAALAAAAAQRPAPEGSACSTRRAPEPAAEGSGRSTGLEESPAPGSPGCGAGRAPEAAAGQDPGAAPDVSQPQAKGSQPVQPGGGAAAAGAPAVPAESVAAQQAASASAAEGGLHEAATEGSDQQGREPQQQPGRQAAAEQRRGVSKGGRDLQHLEGRYVHATYDTIAPHFSATRFAVWPKVRAFLEALPRGALVADIGCGNGKYLGVRPGLAILASDHSDRLTALAAARLAPPPGGSPPGGAASWSDAAVADATALPYRSGVFDAALCVAVLHHLGSVARRVRLLAELTRVLRPGGRALVTVWATVQDPAKLARWRPLVKMDRQPLRGADAAPAPPQGDDAEGSSKGARQAPEREQPPQDYLVPWHIPLHRAGAAARWPDPPGGREPQQPRNRPGGGRSEGRGGRAGSALPEQEDPSLGGGAVGVLDREKGTVVYQRYYHLYEEGELQGLAAQVPGVRVAESYFDKDNWCVVLEKEAAADAGAREAS